MTMEELKASEPPKKTMAQRRQEIANANAKLSPWLRWEHAVLDGKEMMEYKPIEGKLLDVNMEESKKFFNKDNSPRLIYRIKLLRDNMEKVLDGSKAVYDALSEAGVDFDDVIRIERTGSGQMDTRYKVSKIG